MSLSKHSDDISEGPVRVTVCLRAATAPAIQERIDAIRERLSRLERSGRVDAVDVHVWGTRLRPPSSDDQADEHWAIYRSFDEWARTTGNDLGPAFRERTVSSIDSVACHSVEVPWITVAFVGDDGVQFVAPCSTDEGIITVEDALATLTAPTAVHP